MAVPLTQHDLTHQELEDLQSVFAMMPEALSTSEDSIPVIFDTGATKPVTFEQSDFVGPLRRPASPMMMKGIAKGLRIYGIGLLEWKFLDDQGLIQTIKTEGYYIPGLRTRLLSPQAYFLQENGEDMLVNENCCKFQ